MEFGIPTQKEKPSLARKYYSTDDSDEHSRWIKHTWISGGIPILRDRLLRGHAWKGCCTNSFLNQVMRIRQRNLFWGLLAYLEPCRVPGLTQLIPGATRKQDEIWLNLTKNSPDGLSESQETINIFAGVIWATACVVLKRYRTLRRSGNVKQNHEYHKC